MLSPRVLIPFLVVTLIWGSTWIVIKDQLGMVPPSWSVTYRFLLAGVVMLIVARFTDGTSQLGRGGTIFAALFGIAQFVCNFNFVYRAEQHITSGLVAVVFALLFVPNALFSRAFLGATVSRRFLAGSAIAICGLALLFVNEARGDASNHRETIAGIGFTLMGVLSASAANVMQASQRARSLPMAAMLGWGMIWGGAIDACWALFSSGPPVMDWRPAYLAGIGYLAVMASAVAFPLYFRIIRDIGAAKAAYSGVLVPVIAMSFSTVFEGYRWTLLAALGSGIALLGMLVALSAPRPVR